MKPSILSQADPINKRGLKRRGWEKNEKEKKKKGVGVASDDKAAYSVVGIAAKSSLKKRTRGRMNRKRNNCLHIIKKQRERHVHKHRKHSQDKGVIHASVTILWRGSFLLMWKSPLEKGRPRQTGVKGKFVLWLTRCTWCLLLCNIPGGFLHLFVHIL